jgi:molybdopterin-guanine dinucleotide biosynthesis protein A
MIAASGFILAGGRSTRMGEDKALLESGGITLIERVARELRSVCPDVTVIGRSGPGAIPDDCEGLGPAGGIATALRRGAEWNLVVACDLPEVSRELFVELLAHALPALDCVVPVTPDGREHPLCAVFNRRCISAFEDALAAGVRSVRRIVSAMHVVWVKVPDERLLRNVNTPADWQEYRCDVAR